MAIPLAMRREGDIFGTYQGPIPGTSYIPWVPPQPSTQNPPKVTIGKTEVFHEAEIIDLRRRVADLERGVKPKFTFFWNRPERPEDV